MKCPLCGKNELYFVQDAVVSWKIHDVKYETMNNTRDIGYLDEFIVQCYNCGENDETSAKLKDIARNM